MNEPNFLTNTERQHDFKVLSHELFVTAIQRFGLPKGYEGKRLCDIGIEVELEHPRAPLVGALELEALRVSPAIRVTPLSRNTGNLALKMVSTPLTDTLDVEQHFPIEASEAVYSAYFWNHEQPKVVLSGHASDPQLGAAACLFAEETLGKVKSGKTSESDFKIEPGFMMYPDLSLNGREGRKFLFEYFRSMTRKVYDYQATLSQLSRDPRTPAANLQALRESAKVFRDAAGRARKYLKI